MTVSPKFVSPKFPLQLERQESLLASIWCDPEIFPDVSAVVDASHFHVHYAALFRIFADSYKSSRPFTRYEILCSLERHPNAKEQRDAVMLLTAFEEEPVASFTAVNWQYYADELIKAKILRSLYEVGVDLVRLSQSGYAEPDELLDTAYSTLDSAGRHTSHGKGTRQFGEILEELLVIIEQRRKTGTGVGTPTGFPGLDYWTGGLRAGEMTILAARPSEGKTAAGMSIACNIAKSGKRVYVVSREMRQADLAERCIASYAGVSSAKIRQGSYDDDDMSFIATAYCDLKDYQIVISDQATKYPQQIAAEIRRQKCRGGLDLVVVDYLTLMRLPEPLPTYERVSQISSELKSLALEHDVHFLVLAQLNREIEKRGKNARPQLSDLRDSGAIEQDADNVIFIHRDRFDGNGKPLPEVMRPDVELIIAKQRKGVKDKSVKMWWNKELCRFENPASEWMTDPEGSEF